MCLLFFLRRAVLLFWTPLYQVVEIEISLFPGVVSPTGTPSVITIFFYGLHFEGKAPLHKFSGHPWTPDFRRARVCKYITIALSPIFRTPLYLLFE